MSIHGRSLAFIMSIHEHSRSFISIHQHSLGFIAGRAREAAHVISLRGGVLSLRGGVISLQGAHAKLLTQFQDPAQADQLTQIMAELEQAHLACT